MVDMFYEKICNYCKNTECGKNIVVNDIQGIKRYKCNEYIKDDTKIKPYEKPAFITANTIFIET